MLIKRLSPTDQPKDQEVKYMLTADIDHMASLIGVHPERLRALLAYNTEASQSFYGSARPEGFFLNFNEGENAKKPRRLGLGSTDIRLHGPYRIDASQSLVTVPLTVMHPVFVGDLEKEDGVWYELIPHVKLTTPYMGPEQHYVFTNLALPYRDFAMAEHSCEGFEIELSLLGFDLVLLPEENTLAEVPTSSESPGIMRMYHSMKAMYETHSVSYDYGFGVVGKYVYTADNKDCLRIDHYMHYQGRQLYRCEHVAILSPGELLARAVKYVNLGGQKETEFEAYEIMRVIRDSSDFHGIGYHNA